MKLHLHSFFHAVRYALDSANYENVFLKVKQIRILEGCMMRKHVIGVLPTGYGKSVIFHLLPFMCDYLNEKGDRSIEIVISPLNALIEDQLTHLREHRGIKAGVLQAFREQRKVDDSGEDTESDCDDNGDDQFPMRKTSNYIISDKVNSIQKGEFKIVFTHPEAFISCKDGRKIFQTDLYQDRVEFCVINEAHLIEEWGSEFRPDYGKLTQLGSLFPTAPILALTATAPQKRIEYLKDNLHIKNPLVIRGNLDRSNIFICKQKRRPSSLGSASYDDILVPIAEELKLKLNNYPLTIIYLPLKWCGYAYKLFLSILGDRRYSPLTNEKTPGNCMFAQYHAPQTTLMKDEILRQLCSEESNIRVVFATVAIGIGVNIPHVRHVVHLDVPRTIESYYQEIGRAGRDNKPAKATIHYNGSDIASNRSGMTEEMRNYCLLSDGCLRNFLLNYLGSRSELKVSLSGLCCSNCLQESSRDTGNCVAITERRTKQGLVAQFPVWQKVRTVSEGQKNEIRNALKKYRLHLGANRRRFGSIDSTTGFTLKLIDSVVSACESISSAEHIFTSFPIWDRAYAEVIMDIIKSVCEE